MSQHALVLFIALSNSLLYAQGKNIASGNQQWIQYYNQSKLSEKLTLVADAGYRWKDGFYQSTAYIIRTGLGYSVHPAILVSAGFAHLGSYSQSKISRKEFRPYQELGINHTFGKASINNRFRIEERFFNPVANGNIGTPNTFNFRFRYSLMVSIPLFSLSRFDSDRKFLISFGDELLINTGEDIVYNVFDQNRAILSPTVQWTKQLSFSLTYNYQFSSTPIPAQFNSIDVVWLQVRHKLDLSLKKEKNPKRTNIQ
ncbi:MAG: DUF2490 domain-containing protein [Saprospiraceae bacterium]|nr:DUF2490 domain-containing protein [Saprospiraceae bacterium]